MRSLPPLFLLFLPLLGFAAGPRELPNPAGPGAMGSALSVAPGGEVLLSWLEPGGADVWALRTSVLAADAASWSGPRTIATGRDWFINWADFPSVTPLSEREWLAVWFENNPPHAAGAAHHGTGYHTRVSHSSDGGATWSTPARLTHESAVTEFAAVLAPSENAPALVAWLDARLRPGRDVQTLQARTWPASGPDDLVDPSVCDCCQLSLVRTGDSALLAYRGRTAGEVRDIRLARWSNGRWETPRPLHDDGWVIAACPVNGPRLAARGDSVAAVWFTAAQNNPRVQARFSADGGETFGPAVRIDLGRPQGRVDALLLPDGSAVFTWLELTGENASRAGGIYLRRVTMDGTMGEPRLLAASSTARASGFPRIARVADGQLLVTYTRDDEVSRVATLLVDEKWITGTP